MTREIVILTKSTKRGGYCVAGVDTDSGQWVRLTSPERWSHGALTDAHMAYEDGSACEVLDCVRAEIVRETPLDRQPENVLMDVNKKLQKVGTWDLSSVLRIHPAETMDTIYENTDPFLDEESIAGVSRSLVLVRTPWLRIQQRSADPERPKTKANFLYNDQWYNGISVTDPAYYQAEDKTTLKPAHLVISLPDVPFENGQYYKFIAKIFA